MRVYIVIPAYNEEAHLLQTLQSLVNQTVLPHKLVVVNDNSSDGTQKIIDSFSEKYSFIDSVSNTSEDKNAPGAKVVNAFYKGYETLDNNYDIICKFDADLIFPKNYLERIVDVFVNNSEVGMAGGFCYIQKNNSWILEDLTNKDHIRGALKAYRKDCFKQIGKLKKSIGWDTVDELLAQYHGWKIETNPNLKVKHLKPTGESYSAASKYKQGEAFYRMRYGFLLSNLASAKQAYKKGSCTFYVQSLRGYFKARHHKLPFIVSEKEGNFIRKLRWKNIQKKIF
jgi:glycosyltransferase involved in cell wall biosynthesis